MFDRIQEAGLQLDISKYKFHVQEVILLNLLIRKNRTYIGSKKIKVIKMWKML